MQPVEALANWQSWDLGREFPRWQDTLRDGTRVLVRPLGPADAERERMLLEALSPEARRFRFLGSFSQPSEAMIASLTHPRPPREIAFAVLANLDGCDTLVGVGRYATNPNGSECEFALLVREDWQQRGVATLLMRHLIEVAKSRGVKRMWSMDAAANTHMADLAGFLGFHREPDPQDPTQVIHSLWLG